MSIFSGQMETGYASQPISKEICKRDYEKDIERLRNEMESNRNFLIAIDSYLHSSGFYFDKNAVFSLPMLYGSLNLEIKRLDRSIVGLMEEWERNK